MKQDNSDERIDTETFKKKVEVELILSTVHKQYGYDFSHYSRDSLMRRLQEFCDNQKLNHLSEMIPGLLWDKHFFSKFLEKMTIGVTEFFRDTDFFVAFKDSVIPHLSTFPYIKLWHAGCSTGEEAFSMAMMLDASHVLDKSIIYATDINNTALDVAKSGIYPLKTLQKVGDNTLLGEASITDYYHASYGRAKMDDALLSNMTLSYHNLVSDESFGQMNVICCRNVLIYFDRELQDRALQLFSQSLRHGGFLCLGKGESLFNTAIQKDFEAVDLKQRIYRKKIPKEAK